MKQMRYTPTIPCTYCILLYTYNIMFLLKPCNIMLPTWLQNATYGESIVMFYWEHLAKWIGHWTQDQKV